MREANACTVSRTIRPEESDGVHEETSVAKVGWWRLGSHLQATVSRVHARLNRPRTYGRNTGLEDLEGGMDTGRRKKAILAMRRMDGPRSRTTMVRLKKQPQKQEDVDESSLVGSYRM